MVGSGKVEWWKKWVCINILVYTLVKKLWSIKTKKWQTTKKKKKKQLPNLLKDKNYVLKKSCLVKKKKMRETKQLSHPQPKKSKEREREREREWER